jgi:hypothetical protein
MEGLGYANDWFRDTSGWVREKRERVRERGPREGRGSTRKVVMMTTEGHSFLQCSGTSRKGVLCFASLHVNSKGQEPPLGWLAHVLELKIGGSRCLCGRSVMKRAEGGI